MQHSGRGLGLAMRLHCVGDRSAQAQGQAVHRFQFKSRIAIRDASSPPGLAGLATHFWGVVAEFGPCFIKSDCAQCSSVQEPQDQKLPLCCCAVEGEDLRERASVPQATLLLLLLLFCVRRASAVAWQAFRIWRAWSSGGGAHREQSPFGDQLAGTFGPMSCAARVARSWGLALSAGCAALSFAHFVCSLGLRERGGYGGGNGDVEHTRPAQCPGTSLLATGRPRALAMSLRCQRHVLAFAHVWV